MLALADDFELTLPDDEIFFSYIPITAVEKLPAADVRPVVRGKWIEDWETGCSECSTCHDTFLWEDYKGVAEWNFCPNCGAWMEES